MHFLLLFIKINQFYANAICVKLKELIPRQQFDVAIQGAIMERSSAEVRKQYVKTFSPNAMVVILLVTETLRETKEGKKNEKHRFCEVPQRLSLLFFLFRIILQVQNKMNPSEKLLKN